MSPSAHTGIGGGDYDRIPISAINQFLFCPRRAALIHVEGVFIDNQHTLRGDIVHEHADLAGYESQISDSESQIILLRALPVWSDRLGLNGKCDIVEVELPVGAKFQISDFRSQNVKSEISNLKFSMRPVEFKLGKRRKWENDDAQLCAQALCLEEMFGIAISHGAVFHADSKRRREVEFTPGLRKSTEETILTLRSLLKQSDSGDVPAIPPAVYRPACEECSLYKICLPEITGETSRPARMAKALFEI